jgi:hypothetical protein
MHWFGVIYINLYIYKIAIKIHLNSFILFYTIYILTITNYSIFEISI